MGRILPMKKGSGDSGEFSGDGRQVQRLGEKRYQECDSPGRVLDRYMRHRDYDNFEKALSENPEEAHRKDPLGCLLIHYAAEMGDARIIEILIKYESPVEHFGCEGKTPLMLAAERGRTEAVRRLLEAGADPERWSTGSGSVGQMFFSEEPRRALELALEKGHAETAGLIRRYMDPRK